MILLLFLMLGLLCGGLVDSDGWFFGGVLGGLIGWSFLREQKSREQLAKEVATLRAAVQHQQSGMAELWNAAFSKGAASQTPDAAKAVAQAEQDVAAPATTEATKTPLTAAAGAYDASAAAAVQTDVAAGPNLGQTNGPPVQQQDAPQAFTPQVPAPQQAAAQYGMPPSPAFHPQAEQAPQQQIQYPLDRAMAAVKEQLFGGNTVVRVGILILLVGVTLLLKYAADQDLISIELRMAAAGLAGLGLVLGGLRQRTAKPGFSRTLQGGGIATMYLVVFFSFRSYQLLPPILAFGLLAAIAVLSGVLAVVQDAMALVIIGQLGGFLAPILASSGAGNHVALFSYYLLLNVMVAGVAWFRAWRPLNLLGFIFTFGIGTVWGALDYRPEDFATTEPFLIGFFLLYVLVPVLFAVRGKAKGWVDGSLVFGAPLAFLALQLVLVREIPFAMAFTTVGLAALYLGIGFILTRLGNPAFAAMRLSFIALGVGFVTLAIPYAFDHAALSSAAWAIEGAGLYFLGVRQNRALSRAAGVGLQMLSGGAVLMHFGRSIPPETLPFVHGRSLAVVFLGFGCLFIAHHAHKHRERLFRGEATVLQALILWGLLAYLPAVHGELDRVLPDWWLPGAHVGALGALGLFLETLGRKFSWPGPRYVPASLAVLLFPALLLWNFGLSEHLLSRGGAFAWPVYLASLLLTLRHFVPQAPQGFSILHVLVLFGTTLWLALTAYGVCEGPLALNASWSTAAFGVVVAGVLFVLSRFSETKLWPVSAAPERYLGKGRFGLACFATLWVLLLGIASPGDDDIIGYIPVLNPGELFQLFALAALVSWRRSESSRRYMSELDYKVLPKVISVVLFICWNGLLARCAHRYWDVPWDPYYLWGSGPLQVAFAISWTLIGLLLMTLASRRKQRGSWFTGAVLLAVVVLKLFLIDLENLSPVAKIGTFLAVGLLLLVVGYFSPVPPAKTEQAGTSPNPPLSPVPPEHHAGAAPSQPEEHS